jgi:hypothetical protein
LQSERRLLDLELTERVISAAGICNLSGTGGVAAASGVWGPGMWGWPGDLAAFVDA